jgi:hypothetical protein
LEGDQIFVYAGLQWKIYTASLDKSDWSFEKETAKILKRDYSQRRNMPWVKDVDIDIYYSN